MGRGRPVFFFFFSSSTQSSAQRKWRRQSPSPPPPLCQVHTRTQHLHLPYTSFTVTEVISQTNTSYLALGWAHTHTHRNTTAGSLLHTNTLLFVFRQRLCFCSFVMIPQKTSVAEREVLTRIWLAIGSQKKKGTSIILLLSPFLTHSVISPLLNHPHPPNSLALVEVQYLWAASHLVLCAEVQCQCLVWADDHSAGASERLRQRAPTMASVTEGLLLFVAVCFLGSISVLLQVGLVRRISFCCRHLKGWWLSHKATVS